eukprot:1181272-Prorocentrum_minimum.AAC.7
MNTLAASQIRAVCRPTFQERGSTSASVRPCRGPAAVLGDKRNACASLSATRATPLSASRSRIVTRVITAEVEAKPAKEAKPEKQISVTLNSKVNPTYLPDSPRAGFKPTTMRAPQLRRRMHAM